MSHRVILSLGSNIDNRRDNIAAALSALAQAGVECGSVSPEVESPDDTGRGNAYINVAADCRTELSLQALKDRISEIERQCGRVPSSKAMGLMPIDIDVVVWDDEVVSRYDFERPYFKECLHRLSKSI